MTRFRARATGAVYLLYFVTAIVAGSLVGRMPVIYTNAANLIANAVYVALTLLLYQMLKPVSRNVAALAFGISLAGCVVQSLSLFHLVPSASSLPIFGLFNIIIGYLILKSTFVPRVLGILMTLSGLGWLLTVSPGLDKHLAAYIELSGVVAEGSLMLWLLVMGVSVQRWNQQATLAQR